MKTYMAIDNGVSGSLAVIYPEKSEFMKMPVKSQLSYTKAKNYITRIDYPVLKRYIESIVSISRSKGQEIFCVIERPMVNPGRFKATGSALRCLESVLIALEENEIPIQYLDSKEWQKDMLPKGLQREALKSASLDIGSRLFPQHVLTIRSQKDADSLLMAEWARRKNL